MTDLQCSARPALSPAARALRLQRIFARLQEGASYKDIAEGLSRERLRQIVQTATERGRAAPDHKRMQFARLEPAPRLAQRRRGGDAKAIGSCVFVWTASNPLKSPESYEGIQENPSPFSWSGLAIIWFGLEA